MTVLNSPNTNRSWTAQQLADGAKLSALFHAGDEAGLKREKFAHDSVGQWFKDGALVPSPPKTLQAAEIGVIPFAR